MRGIKRRVMKLNLSRLKAKYVLLGVIVVVLADIMGLFSHILETHYDDFSYPLDLDLMEIVEAKREGRKIDVKPINNYNYTYLISNSIKCKVAETREYEDITLLILVKSAMNNFKQRDAIRNSWGFERRFSDVKIRTLFMVGINPYNEDQNRKIVMEDKKYNDLIQSNFVDAYYNNTIKTMMGFKWAVTNCPKTQFVFLVDDDMYVSVKNLLKFLRNPLNIEISAGGRKLSGVILKSNNVEDVLKDEIEYQDQFDDPSNPMDNRKRFYDGRLYGGYLFPDSSPMRHKTSKWYVSLSEYPFHKYPPYISAGAVALSFPALSDMFAVSFYTKHFRFDDIYMGILAKKAQIEPIHRDDFYFWGKEYSKEGYRDVIVAHGFDNPQILYKSWEEQRSSGNA